MQVSRSETHLKDKLKRKKRFRRLVIINFTLLGVIIVLLGAWLAAANSDKLQQMLNLGDFGKKEQVEAQQPNSDAGKGHSQSGNGTEMTEDDGTVGIGDNALPDDEDTAGVPPLADNDDADKVSLSFVGDLLIGEYVNAVMQQEGYDFLYKNALLYLSEPDLTAGNLEYPVTNRGIPAEGKEYVYKGSPDALPALRDAGFDIVNLANNHTLDQGIEGLQDTMKYLDEAGISHMGAGNNDTEAFAPVIKEVRGIKVAYIGLSRVIPTLAWKADKNVAGVAETYDTRRAVAAIAKAKEQADIVVVMVHWGNMGVDQPLQYQKDYGKEYIDAGADLVIGSHPHVLQGFETYKGKWIAYSLGNFIFSAFPKGTAGDTGVLDAVCTKSGDCELTFHPMFTVNAQPTPLEAEEAKALLDRLTAISFGVKLGNDGKLIPVK
ncbi:poly-gamma-glutamate synthesis protein (capsule biosynthesis protein) [Paenibacillus castaneae]|uniref:CapA family protein n=1 Tax=Paenibacillus castaneae TaxID=474957 RepID=UPI000C9AB49C|nr:CapA family protein [Paenibacillus castaneae]NIK77305.1 poly-gamma-glutamate synthesis protein (capsule biosynthesis protein) [Paenibacillus castaneae]